VAAVGAWVVAGPRATCWHTPLQVRGPPGDVTRTRSAARRAPRPRRAAPCVCGGGGSAVTVGGARVRGVVRAGRAG